jgi:hypothetical protein
MIVRNFVNTLFEFFKGEKVTFFAKNGDKDFGRKKDISKFLKTFKTVL